MVGNGFIIIMYFVVCIRILLLLVVVCVVVGCWGKVYVVGVGICLGVCFGW